MIDELYGLCRLNDEGKRCICLRDGLPMKTCPQWTGVQSIVDETVPGAEMYHDLKKQHEWLLKNARRIRSINEADN
jgi:hypothetical protein